RPRCRLCHPLQHRTRVRTRCRSRRVAPALVASSRVPSSAVGFPGRAARAVGVAPGVDDQRDKGRLGAPQARRGPGVHGSEFRYPGLADRTADRSATEATLGTGMRGARRHAMTPVHPIAIGPYTVGGGHPLLWVCGPCVIEGHDITLRIADTLRGYADA